MKLNKAARTMVYQCALTEQKDHPEWSVHTCLEEAFIKCGGMANYNLPLQSMLKEYSKNEGGTIQSFIDAMSPKTITP